MPDPASTLLTARLRLSALGVIAGEGVEDDGWPVRSAFKNFAVADASLTKET